MGPDIASPSSLYGLQARADTLSSAALPRSDPSAGRQQQQAPASPPPQKTATARLGGGAGLGELEPGGLATASSDDVSKATMYTGPAPRGAGSSRPFIHHRKPCLTN